MHLRDTMSGMDGRWIAPVGVLLAVLAVDVWVYTEARSRRARGQSVVATVGPVTLSTPEQWLLGCLVLWIFVLPLYLVARNA